jgi:SPP1 family predicted phage head-tail adaptor
MEDAAMRDKLVKLIGHTPVKNSAGIVVSRTDTVVTVCWAALKSVSRSEYYAAAAAGINVDDIFEVSKIDYDHEVHDELEYDGKRYEIVRSYYSGRGDGVDLTVRRRDI